MSRVRKFAAARGEEFRERSAKRAQALGRGLGGPEIDSADMCVALSQYEPSPPLVLHIVYRDAAAAHSSRNITLRGLTRSGGELRVGAVCHMRNRYRCFLASRIVEVSDLVTGEVSEDGPAYFLDLWQALHGDDEVLEVRAIRECLHELVILATVAGADGVVAGEEVDELVKHVLDRACQEGLTEEAVRQRIMALSPDEETFEEALGRICAGEGDAKALMRSLRRLVDADGRLDPEEVAVLMEIEATLRAVARI